MVEYFLGKKILGDDDYWVNTKFPHTPTSFREKNTEEVNKP
jgi:hypothetical protein